MESIIVHDFIWEICGEEIIMRKIKLSFMNTYMKRCLVGLWLLLVVGLLLPPAEAAGETVLLLGTTQMAPYNRAYVTTHTVSDNMDRLRFYTHLPYMIGYTWDSNTMTLNRAFDTDVHVVSSFGFASHFTGPERNATFIFSLNLEYVYQSTFVSLGNNYVNALRVLINHDEEQIILETPRWVLAGDKIHVRVTGKGPGGTAEFYHGADLLFKTNPFATESFNGNQIGFNLETIEYTLEFYDPIVRHNPDVSTTIGVRLQDLEQLEAHWGWTTSNLIEPRGQILDVTTPTLLSKYVNAAGTFHGIGTFVQTFEVRDEHSLSNVGYHQFDTTVTYADRQVTVKTDLAPQLSTTYSALAVSDSGTTLSGMAYDADDGLTPCGGEQGWTNQPLDILLDPMPILGEFDSALFAPPLAATVVTNGSSLRSSYNNQSPTTAGTLISGVLTIIGDISKELSGTVTSIVKIDTTNPTPAATHNGGPTFTDSSTDTLSGLSDTRPSKIAFSQVGDPQPADALFTLFDAIPVMPNGNYDVWVWATDKAGNTAIERVLPNIYIQFGEVLITKDTNQGATLHTPLCPNTTDVTVDTCTPDCTLGTTIQIEEKSDLTYKLTLINTDTIDPATGTFTDYLPLGSIVSTTPTAIPASSASNLDFALETTGPYTGHYKITGDYTLAPGAQVEINILSKAPPFDKVVPTNNVIRNQATLDWTIDTRSGSNDSNFALHELTERPSVDTLFTKVGADALTTGLIGAEFALYRWNGALPPTPAEENQWVDPHGSLTDGDWTRVTYDGEDATSMSDVFTSAGSPQGEVDFGALPTGIYTLIETKTAAGYELPVGQWILTIDASKSDTGPSDWKIEFVGKSNSIMPPAAIRDTGGAEPTYRIINARPFSIGMSGLGGTKGLLLAGFVLMALAGNAYIANNFKKRGTSKKNK